MDAPLALLVGERRGPLRGAVAPTALDAPHDRVVRVAPGRQPWRPRGTPLLGLTVRPDGVAAWGRPLRDGAPDAAHHAAGEAAPGAVAPPGLAWPGLRTCAVTLPQRTSRETRPRRCPPPARAGHGQAPEAGGVCSEPKDRATPCLGRQGGQGECAGGAGRWGRLPSAGGAGGATRLVVQAQRRRARPSWRPVAHAQTGARARHRPWA
jgi:hypothetical protein